MTSTTISAGASPASLAGVHALVTGGARGIGEAVARSLLAQGARVTLLGRNQATLASGAHALAAHGEVAWVSADISDAAAVAAAFARAAGRFGPVQVLVNNAGQALSAPFGKTDSALWQQMIDVNLTGTFHCISAALPSMLSAGWGRIVNVASTAGLIGYPYVTAYCAAKHGVVGLTRALALEVAKKGVTVNAVCPGIRKRISCATRWPISSRRPVVVKTMRAPSWPAAIRRAVSCNRKRWPTLCCGSASRARAQ